MRSLFRYFLKYCMGYKDVTKKQFKDPVYGYIEIDRDLVSEIVDTPAFQRLKDIRQTSYAPLFPGAYHNRYIHSLGVYHLGRIAFSSIMPQLKELGAKTNIVKQLEKLQNTFDLACLLHDIGHAPFSHTGENFFLVDKDTLYLKLKESVGVEAFSNDFDALATNKPAPHECMSCVVGLNTFPEYFKTLDDRNIFARCIIGMPIRFLEKTPSIEHAKTSEERKKVTKQREAFRTRKTEVELLNCVISLLNSAIIDVDRLDYIIRDATTIGFKNAQVDYARLLNGMRIVSFQDSLCIGYHKSALSVIESAVYAHDAEKKWIQGHPSILYEMEALKNAMSMLTKIFATKADPNPLFCYEALTEKGKELSLSFPLFSEEGRKLFNDDNMWTEDAKGLLEDNELFAEGQIVDTRNFMITRNYPVSLLADEDFLYLMKCFCKDGLGHEYFARNKRRSAVWKSEAEFRTLFQETIGDDSAAIRTLEDDFEGLGRYCLDKTGVPIVNANILTVLDEEEEDAKNAISKKEIDQERFDDLISWIKTRRHWVMILQKTAGELDIAFEFLIISQKRFNSSFKDALGEIPISFPKIDKVVPLSNIVNVLKPSAKRKSNFFHLFYQSSVEMKDDQKKKIAKEIPRALIANINYQ